jgi:hypothetical protein
VGVHPQLVSFRGLFSMRALSGVIACSCISVSVDTLKREYRHLVKKLSPRRAGIRLRDVLAIGETRSETP